MLPNWIAPTPQPHLAIMPASEDAIRCDDLTALADHLHVVRYFDKTQQTLANSTTKTSVASYTVPASYLGTTGILTWAAAFRAKCTSGATNNVAVHFQYGGVSLVGAIAGIHAYNDFAIAFCRGVLIADAATGAQVAYADVFGGHQSGGWIASQGVPVAVAVDSTLDQALTMHLQSDRLNADASWTYYYFAVFGAPA